MLVLVAVWGLTLGIIYFTTYTKVNRENQEMLRIYADAYDSHGLPREELRDPQEKTEPDETGKNLPPDKESAQEDEELTHRYEVSTFFAVIFDKEGNVKEYLNQSTSEMTDSELQDWAHSLLDGMQDYGVKGNIVYYITAGDDYTMVTMMDNSVAGAAINTLLHYMLLFGGLSLLVLLILSAVLANWVVKPLAEGYEKQKIFISDAGHELKTPISAIGANLELLQREIGKNKWLDNITYENRRMSVMVHQLLELARIEHVPVSIENVDFSRTAMAAILPFEAKAFEEGITLDYEIEDGLHVMGDVQNLEKLLSILIDNAISHSMDGADEKAIHISAEKTKKEVHVTVANRGEEIPPEDRERIFERFYRTDPSRSGGQGHYGLGLAIAKSIVSAFGGKIWITCKDGWVMFHVLLEAAEERK